MIAVSTPDMCKTVVQDSAIQIAVNHLLHIRPEKTIMLGKALIIDLFKFFKMILNTLKTRRTHMFVV